MILARYCSRTVFQEQMEQIRHRGSIYGLTTSLAF